MLFIRKRVTFMLYYVFRMQAVDFSGCRGRGRARPSVTFVLRSLILVLELVANVPITAFQHILKTFAVKYVPMSVMSRYSRVYSSEIYVSNAQICYDPKKESCRTGQREGNHLMTNDDQAIFNCGHNNISKYRNNIKRGIKTKF